MSRIFTLFTLIFVVGCKKDIPPTPPQSDVTLQPNSAALVVNEGNFQFGNASLSVLDFSSGKVANEVYKSANSRSLGDVFQSLTHTKNNLYAIVNNSKKVEVLDPETFVSKGDITGFQGPRYLTAVSPAKGFVSDIYSNKLWVVDLNQLIISDSIALPGWTEQMEYLYGDLFVCNLEKQNLYVVDAKTHSLVDSISISLGANSMVQDKFGHIWVLCDESLSGGSGAALYEIDPIGRRVLKLLNFPSGANPSDLTSNGSQDTLYYLNNGVYAFPIKATRLSQDPMVEEGNKTFYGLAIHPESSHLFVTDAVDYVQRGYVEEYDQSGVLLQQYQVGIIPSELIFY